MRKGRGRMRKERKNSDGKQRIDRIQLIHEKK